MRPTVKLPAVTLAVLAAVLVIGSSTTAPSRATAPPQASAGPDGTDPGSAALPAAGPLGRILVAPGLHLNHYWAGAEFAGTSGNASQVTTTVTLPNAAPASAELYYVLLSVFDSAGFYDQIGFSSDYGTWGFAYEYFSPCGGTGTGLSANALTLKAGATYTFSMNLSGGGRLTFSVRQGGTYLRSISAVTHASHFAIQSKYSCRGTSYIDYTDYEEVFYLSQKMPSFNFAFVANTANNSSVTSWKSMGAPQGGGRIAFAGSAVFVENEPFKLSFNPGYRHPMTFANGTTSFQISIKVHRVFNGSNITLSMNGPSAFVPTFSTGVGAPGFSTNVSFTVNGTVPGAWYGLTLKATDPSGIYTYLTLRVKVG